jgi:hypothetical protein
VILALQHQVSLGSLPSSESLYLSPCAEPTGFKVGELLPNDLPEGGGINRLDVDVIAILHVVVVKVRAWQTHTIFELVVVVQPSMEKSVPTLSHHDTALTTAYQLRMVGDLSSLTFLAFLALRDGDGEGSKSCMCRAASTTTMSPPHRPPMPPQTYDLKLRMIVVLCFALVK